jgi:hypothetical protein
VTDVVTENESPIVASRELIDKYRADIERICPVPGTADPWRNWFKGLHFPRGPLDAIEDMIVAADRRRLAMPTTKRFAAIWAEFREQHEYLESTAYRRCVRYLIWRAAALKVKCEIDRFQDVIDRNQCLCIFRPMRSPNGSAT